MRSHHARILSPLALVTMLGCGEQGSGDGFDVSADPPPASPGDAERAIAEADIIQIDGGRLYAMSRLGTVTVVDVSVPGRLAVLGQTRIQGEPFEMYRRGDVLVTMSNAAVSSGGFPSYEPRGTDPGASSVVIALDVRDPGNIVASATLAAPGEIADSRILGDVLYLVTFENSACFGCGTAPRTLVTSVDVSDPLAMTRVDQVSFESNAPDGYNLPWGSAWKRSVVATDRRLYVGGHADIHPDDLETGRLPEGIIDVLDIGDPSGRLRPGARLVVAGAILSRWQVDERDGILRVVSQRGAGRTANGLDLPEVETFRIESTRSFVPLGRLTMRLPMQEGLRTVRFDGERAYAITYNQTDPLFVIDLSAPASPVQRGELLMPGFMFHLEPRGDRLIGLGIDRTDPAGSLNVSLFDVSDPDAPGMIERVSFATPGITEDYAILDQELAEDQDRIQKAFRVFPDGLVAVPFSALRSSWEVVGCDNTGGGVQLVEWTDDTLVKRALLPLPGNPRRALPKDGQMLAISDSNVRSFSLARTDVAVETADLVIDACIAPEPYAPYEVDEGYDDQAQHCSAGGGGGPAAAVLLALVAVRLRRRRIRTGR